MLASKEYLKYEPNLPFTLDDNYLNDIFRFSLNVRKSLYQNNTNTSANKR